MIGPFCDCEPFSTLLVARLPYHLLSRSGLCQGAELGRRHLGLSRTANASEYAVYPVASTVI